MKTAIATCQALAVVLALLGPLGAAKADEGIAREHGWNGFWLGAHGLASSGFRKDVTEPAEGRADEVRYGAGAGLGLRAGYDYRGVLGAFLAAELSVGREGPYRSLGGGARVMLPLGHSFRLGTTAGVRFIDSDPTLPFVTAGALMEWPLSSRLGMSLEVDKAWPLGGARFRDGGAGTRQQVEARSGPWRGVLALTWYFRD
ncbi:hypothetical protein [Myxococcus sp. Y35]|uniref:hypothetical protein n=1 Tax=Pseudomyxococcus flavus TaxID=3115648 RepID=UPI003CED95C5